MFTYTERNHQMKTKTKTTSVKTSAPVQSNTLTVKELSVETIVSEAQASLSIADIIANDESTFEGVSSADVASFVASELEASAGGMRRAILCIDRAIVTGDQFANDVKAVLYGKYAKPTIDCIYTAARKTVPALRGLGINPASVDVYNLRAVNPALCDKTHKAHKAVVSALKDGKKSAEVAKVYKEKSDAKPRKAGGETAVVEPAKTVNSHDHLIARIKADAGELSREKTFGEKQARFLLLRIARQFGATVEEFNQAAGKKH